MSRRDVKNKRQCILVISDLHTPYGHKDTVKFLEAVKKKYRPTDVVLTGDECFPPEAEILTSEGFVRFDKLVDMPTKDRLVAQWNEDGSIEFVTPIRYVKKPFDGQLLEYRQSNMVSRTTPRHGLVKIDMNGNVRRREAWDTHGSEHWAIPRFGKCNGPGCGYSFDELALMVAFQADGTFTKGAVRFSFSKRRKFERLTHLLDRLEIPYNIHNVKRGDLQVYIEKSNVPKYLSKEFDFSLLSTMTLGQRICMLNEFEHWDGTITRVGFRYISTNKANVDFLSCLAVTSGHYASKIGECKKEKDHHNQAYYIGICWNKEKTTLKSSKERLVYHVGEVYCVTVPSGMIVVRQDGHVSVSSNCDYHSLSYHDSDPDLDSAGVELEKAVLALSPLYKMFPDAHILHSNHGSLHLRKAITHGFPHAVFKSTNEILSAPAGWKWVNDLVIETIMGPVYFHHSRGPALRTAQLYGMSHVCGHLHESFNITYWSTPHKLLFAMTVGCLVDKNSLAMAYNKNNQKRPIIGLGVIVNGIPELVPMILNENGRWVGHLNGK